MMSNECERVQDQLIFHLDGEDTELDVEKHLKSCALCQEKMRSLEILRNLISALPRKPLPEIPLFKASAPLLTGLPKKKLPENFDQQILKAIRKERTAKIPMLRRGAWKLVQPLAAAVIIIYLSFSGFQSLRPTPEYKNTLNIEFQYNKSFYSHTLKKKVGRASLEMKQNSEDLRINNSFQTGKRGG